jgi:hypothetical protein
LREGRDQRRLRSTDDAASHIRMKALLLTPLLLSACCLSPVTELSTGSGSTSGGTTSGGGCPQIWDGGCEGPDLCTTQQSYACVTGANEGGSACLGEAGAICQGNCDCLSDVCSPPFRSDCFPPNGCPGDAGPSTCGASAAHGPCLSNLDCGYGVCTDAGADLHTAGQCCAPEHLECTVDSDCCPGLSCATDNTGCRVGPTPVCNIDGGIFQSGATDPDNDCLTCDPYTSPTAWNILGAPGQYAPPCGDGGHPGGIGPGIDYCCNGVCTDSCND